MSFLAHHTPPNTSPTPQSQTAPSPLEAAALLHIPGENVFSRSARLARAAAQGSAASTTISTPPPAPDATLANAVAATAGVAAAGKVRRKSAASTMLARPTPALTPARAILQPRTLLGS